MPGKRAPLVERFWSKVEKTETCWLWRSATRSSTGYGMIGAGRGHMFLAHRLAYLWEYGEIPPKLLVCHHCDNKLCVRANDHLFLGTHKDNTRDMMRKGRQRMGSPYRIYRGEDHIQSKLTNVQRLEMTQRYVQGGISFKRLGADYGICPQAAWKIISRMKPLVLPPPSGLETLQPI